ncbi:MAG TPA: SBBP repeat-containing protein, partial [Candidatus Solibacter sp.]|nr:SBBP repeat-containing protein [Candidatus Solibacter sp.]
GRIRYRDVYPGIDVVYYGAKGTLEHDMIVRPGASPAVIAMAFHGAESIDLDGSGAAIIRNGSRSVEWKKPVLYQETGGVRVPVWGRYRRNGAGELAFEVGAYDATQPLIIDPVVTYASYQGHSDADAGARMAIDAQGNTYLAGYTTDSSFPVSPGAYSPGTGFGNKGNGFVIKYNATNSAIVYSTYIGGRTWDAFSGMAIDTAGNVYVTGITDSDDYPVTPGALKTKLHSAVADTTSDCVVTKLNAAGNGLVYSTYLGGTGSDACTGMAVDPQGFVYLTGATRDPFGFPLSDNAPQRQSRGFLDAFIVKLNQTGTAVVYGTLLGGTDIDSGLAIAIDQHGAAYITGQTASFNLPVTAGAYQRTLAGVTQSPAARMGDAFVAKLSPDGGTFQYVTYLGGRNEDVGMGIAVDSQGNAYVAGDTLSDTFPTTPGAFQTTYKGLAGNQFFPGGDAFVAKLNPTGTALVYSTYLGGAKDDWAVGITVDTGGKVWVAGATLSSDFPVTSDAAQKTYAGGNPVATFPTGDAWVAQLDASGSSMIYGTFLGGKEDEYATSVVLDSAGNAYLTGSTFSSDFPVTSGALQKGYGGTNFRYLPVGDAFIVKLSLMAPPPPPPAPTVTVSSVSSAASYAGGGVAPGEIVVLAGSGIGPKDLVTAQVIGGTKLATQISNTQVLFDNTPAPLVYVSATQTAAIVPYGVAGKTTTQLVVLNGSDRSTALPITVLSVHPALFSANASGRGQGAILNEDNSYNTSANPALKGHLIQLYGTGEGQTNPAGIDGLLALTAFPKPVAPLSVTVGGQNAEVVYYGAAPQAVAGLLQMNARVPDNIASGDAEVIIQVGSAKSQTGLTVAVR